ncbi:MAG: hypothetical protein PHP42_08745 [Bacteroidota bacterium]|nr:hypothetical protein [Bacteroidota bacterium]
MDTPILEHIKYTNLYVKALDYNKCGNCSFVNCEENETVDGHPCIKCKEPSEGSCSFFGANALSMIELIQESYQKLMNIETDKTNYPSGNERTQSASVVLFFCTVKEILLEGFISDRMHYLKLPNSIQRRLGIDYNTHNDRLKKLFPALVGLKWDDALKELTQQQKNNYFGTSNFLKEITRTGLKNEIMTCTL